MSKWALVWKWKDVKISDYIDAFWNWVNLISHIFLFTVTLKWASLQWLPSPRMAIYTLKVIQWNLKIVDLNAMNFLLFNGQNYEVKSLVIGYTMRHDRSVRSLVQQKINSLHFSTLPKSKMWKIDFSNVLITDSPILML